MPALKIFISYSHNEHDLKVLDRLRNQLRALGDAIDVWEDRLLLPGDPWDEAIRAKLEAADLVLLLISENFIGSEYIQTVELKRAIERHVAGECRVVGIYARYIYFQDQVYARSELLPKSPRDGKLYPIDSKSAWDSDAEPYAIVIENLNKLIADLHRQQPNQGHAPAGAATWPELFGQLPLLLDEIELLQTINCDRRRHFVLELSDHLDKCRNADSNLIYLLPVCPRQQPLSLAKRLVYQRFKDFSGFFHRTQEEQEQHQHQREVDDKVVLKIKPEREATWGQFWKNVQHYILKTNEPDFDFEPFLRQAQAYWANTLRFALVFRVQQNHWNNMPVERHLAYIADQLARLPEGARKFVVFFACEFDYIDCEPNRSKYADQAETLRRLADEINAAGTGNIALALHDLPPVDSDDVNAWLNEVTDNDETNRHLVWPMLQRDMTEEECQRLQQNLYNLRRIESMQDAAYRYALQHAP